MKGVGSLLRTCCGREQCISSESETGSGEVTNAQLAMASTTEAKLTEEQSVRPARTEDQSRGVSSSRGCTEGACCAEGLLRRGRMACRSSRGIQQQRPA